MLRIGWFSTGRGEGSQKLLRAAVDAIRDGRLDAEIAFVFSNREPGQFEATDTFFDQVRVVRHPARHAVRPALPPRARRRGRAHGPAAAGVAHRVRPRGRRAAARRTPATSACSPATCSSRRAPLFESHPLLNLHPAAPGQPAGTWQDVTWKLIEQRVDHGGVRIHLGDAGARRRARSSRTARIRCAAPTIDLLWRGVEHAQRRRDPRDRRRGEPAVPGDPPPRRRARAAARRRDAARVRRRTPAPRRRSHHGRRDEGRRRLRPHARDRGLAREGDARLTLRFPIELPVN